MRRTMTVTVEAIENINGLFSLLPERFFLVLSCHVYLKGQYIFSNK